MIDSGSTDCQQLYVEKLCRHMRELRPVPTAHYCKRRPFTQKDLYTSTHVLLKVVGEKRSLDQPFEGPYEVLEGISDNVFEIKVGEEPMTDTTERLKPANFDSTPHQLKKTPPSQNDPPNQPKFASDKFGTSDFGSFACRSAAIVPNKKFIVFISSCLDIVVVVGSNSADSETSSPDQSSAGSRTKRMSPFLMSLAPPTVTPRPDVPP